MRVELTGRHIDITPGLRRLVDQKLSRIERLLHNSAVSAQVVLSIEKTARRADVTLHARGEKFLHGIGRGVGIPAALTEAFGKLAKQAQRIKGKWQEPKRRVAESVRLSAAREDAPIEPSVRPKTGRMKLKMPQTLRASRQAIVPMSVADAARRLDGQDGIVVFRDIETSAITVVYRARSGELALVETA